MGSKLAMSFGGGDGGIFTVEKLKLFSEPIKIKGKRKRKPRNKAEAAVVDPISPSNLVERALSDYQTGTNGSSSSCIHQILHKLSGWSVSAPSSARFQPSDSINYSSPSTSRFLSTRIKGRIRAYIEHEICHSAHQYVVLIVS